MLKMSVPSHHLWKAYLAEAPPALFPRSPGKGNHITRDGHLGTSFEVPAISQQIQSIMISAWAILSCYTSSNEVIFGVDLKRGVYPRAIFSSILPLYVKIGPQSRVKHLASSVWKRWSWLWKTPTRLTKISSEQSTSAQLLSLVYPTLLQKRRRSSNTFSRAMLHTKREPREHTILLWFEIFAACTSSTFITAIRTSDLLRIFGSASGC